MVNLLQEILVDSAALSVTVYLPASYGTNTVSGMDGNTIQCFLKAMLEPMLLHHHNNDHKDQ